MLQPSLFEQADIEPIDQKQREQVLDLTLDYIGRAEQIFTARFPRVEIKFDLSGRTAGMYKVVGRHRCIRYNPWIFSKFYQENLTGTVPHEVAHFAIDQIYGMGRVKPHGIEWRALMAKFDADAGVTFDLNLDGVPQRKQNRHPYQCHCQRHDVSTTRHNRVLRGQNYFCVRCKGKLVCAR